MIKPKELVSKMWRPTPDDSSRSDFFRFERNERTTLYKEKEFNEIISTISSYDLVAYGELEPFYNKIIEWLNIDRSNLLLTSGSDAGIKSIYETYITEDDEVLITLPNYAMFSVYADMFGAKKINHYYEKDLTLNVDQLIHKINSKTKLVVISNPGHTGAVIAERELVVVIEKAGLNKSLVLIDEAYHHFYPETMIDYIDRFENIVLTRTFSKAFGLASLRIGLLIGCKKIINELYKVKLVHEITGVAAKIGGYFIDHMDLVDQYVNEVNQGKNVLYKRLGKTGFEVLKSETNFVFFKTTMGVSPIGLKQYLEENCIFIKGPFSKHPFDNHLRITVGDEEQMNYFCDTLDNFLINN
jgi:histidinol-phosphate aminotransferase